MEQLAKQLEAKLNQAIKNNDDFAVSILLTRLHNMGYKVVDISTLNDVE